MGTITSTDSTNYHFEEPKSFWKRISKDVFLNLVISGLFFMLLFFKDSTLATLICLSFFIVQLCRSYIFNRFYIYEIKVNDGICEISYLDVTSHKSVSGSKDDFSITKERTFSRAAIPFLSIKWRDNPTIKQFAFGDWNENKMDEILLLLDGKPGNSLMHKLYQKINSVFDKR